MTQWTPEPWKVNSFSGPNLACCGAGVTDIFTEEGDERVSVARVAYRDKGGDFGSRDEQKANARLIALAPEMAQGLRAIVQVLDGSQPMDSKGALFVAQTLLARLDA